MFKYFILSTYWFSNQRLIHILKSLAIEWLFKDLNLSFENQEMKGEIETISIIQKPLA